MHGPDLSLTLDLRGYTWPKKALLKKDIGKRREPTHVRQIALASPPHKKSGDGTASVQHTSAKGQTSQGQLDRNQRENHHLPLRRGVASPAQLAVVEHALALFLRISKGTNGQAPDPESAHALIRGGLALRLIVDLGRDPNQLSRLARIHMEVEETPTGWGLVSWWRDGSLKLGWWLPAGVHINTRSGFAEDAARGAIWLPVLERTHQWLDFAGVAQIGWCSRLLRRTPSGLGSDIAAFRNWAAQALGSLGNAFPTPEALAGALVDRLAWQPTGDRVVTNQITGRDMNRSAARSYYTRWPSKKAAKRYLEQVDDPAAEPSLTASADGSPSIAMPAFVDDAVTSKGQRTSLATLQDLLALQPRTLDRRRNVVEEHAALVVRLWVVLALSTAARGITRWVPDTRRIEPRTGAFLVRDKDLSSVDPPDTKRGRSFGAALGRSRLVFLHPTGRSLLERYHAHLHAISKRPELSDRARKLILGHILRFKNGELLPLLVLNRHSDGKRLLVRKVGPLWISAWAKANLNEDLARNFARHALRSGLAGQIPQDAIDALLGHFDHGTEHWRNGSAFDPVVYRALLHAVFEAYFGDVADFTKYG